MSPQQAMNDKPSSVSAIHDVSVSTETGSSAPVTSIFWDDLVCSSSSKKEGTVDSVNRRKLQCAEKMLRGAYVELYRGLMLLRSYRSLNMVAFVKIVKKFDKVSKQKKSSEYIKTVRTSHFITSDKVVRAMDEVESIFVKHFTNSDRKKAMKFLKPRHRKDTHVVSFLVGLFTGCFATLFAVYAVLAHLSGMFGKQTEEKYVDIIYPVFCFFALISLHIFIYGCNLLAWKITRINYKFIFEFSPTTALSYRDAFLISTSFMTLIIATMVAHLVLRIDAIAETLLLVFLVLLLCPFNIFYRSTRSYFLQTLRNIAFSPFYKVFMVDFFMADQLTSQVPLLRHLESTACFLLAGLIKTHSNKTCKSANLYRQVAYVVSFLPYYWRAMQCVRRWCDECDLNHLANFGKYISAMVAAGARMTYAAQPTAVWMYVALVTSVIATIYQLYWDFIMDWGLLNSNSLNPWLRNELILKKKSLYYLSIVLNIVLRVAWVENVIRFNGGMFETRVLDFLLASMEIIRRGLWNFYRLENEHINNVGMFKAVKRVPLPFHHEDSDD